MSTNGTKSMLDSIVAVGQASRRSVGAVEIEKFIASRPNVNGPVAISNLRGNTQAGASSGIVIFHADYDSSAGRKSHDLVLRHAPGSETRLLFDYDLGRQFQVQRALQGSGVPVPDPLWLDEDGHYLGVPGFIMTLAHGEAANASAFTKGPLAEASPADRNIMLDAVMQSLVAVHSLDYHAAGLDGFVMQADGVTPMQKYVNWYWRTWQWIDLPEFSRLVPVHDWLVANAPSGGETLIHGDSSLHNYMFVDTRLTSVLDWEMSCIAGRECDLALQITTNELFAAPRESGMLQPPTQSEWLERYQRAGGAKIDQLDYYLRFTAYMILIVFMSAQRNMSDEMRAAQRPLIDQLWKRAEG